MTKKPKIDKDRNIGDVVFIVEGDSTEHILLKSVFNSLLAYPCFSKTRTSTSFEICERKKNHKRSRVAIISSTRPQIDSLGDEKEYLRIRNDLFLAGKGWNLSNSAIFYLFDKDQNKNPLIEERLKVYSNSRESKDDDDTHAGLLLLSYPCVESLCCQIKNEEMFFKDSKEAKQYVSRVGKTPSSITQKDLKNSVSYLKEQLKATIGVDLKVEDLDDASSINLRVHDYEKNLYQNERKYLALSMLSLALIDLGIISIE